jgi:RNA polymerase sigma-70 factor, ECF subfamily
MSEQAQTIEQAFAQLQQGLRAFLRKRVSDSAVADDLLQDVFVKALIAQRKAAAQQRPIENITGWIYAAARTTLIDYYRANQLPMNGLDSVDEHELAQNDEQSLEAHAMLSMSMRPFIMQLPEKYRDVLIATEFEGKTLRELADAEGVSVSAMKSRAARGRVMLKDKVLDCCSVELTNGYVSEFRKNEKAVCKGCN